MTNTERADTPSADYVRPELPHAEYLDENGQVIRYGERWSGSPPEGSYSVASHTERYAVLHTVATALINHLVERYDVDVTDDLTVGDDLVHPFPGALRAVRISPRRADAAELSIVFTDFPGIAIHAGALHDSAYPMCGCDACDTSAEGEVEELEERVLAVADGRFQEGITSGRNARVWESVDFPDGGASTRESSTDDDDADRLAAASRILDARQGEWQAWPLRPATH